MPQVQTVEATSDSTLSKLLEADAALVAQAATLAAQLEAIEEKRQGLRTVIELFSSTDHLPQQQSQTDEQSDEQSQPAPAPSNTSIEVSEETTGSKKQASKGTKASDSERKPAKATRKSQEAEEVKGWQHYIRKEFAKTSLPQAVASVLQSQPEAVLGVPEIVDTLFVDATPQAARNDARNRVSNVLSIGLKNDKWYRAKKGKYSLSREVAEASVAS